MKDAVDHINDIYGRLSDVESIVQRHGYREKVSMPFDMVDLFGPIYSTPEQPHFDAYMAQIEVHLAKPLVVAPCIFSVLKGNLATPGIFTQVWWGPMLPADASYRQFLFPTPTWGTSYPYPLLGGTTVSPLWSPDLGDTMRLGMSVPGDGGQMTAFIDWVPQRSS